MRTKIVLTVVVCLLVVLARPVGANPIAAGARHTVINTPDGHVWVFGNNGNCQLGDGSSTDRKTPVQISNFSGVIAVAAGSLHSLALKSDGTVYAWGYNGQ